MATFLCSLISTAPLCISNLKKQPRSCSPLLSSTTMASSSQKLKVRCSNEASVRRSANYQPPIWSYDYIQSLNTNKLPGNSYKERIDVLKEDVMLLLDQVTNLSDMLELVSTLQRLGVAYHFDDKIKIILEDIFNHKYEDNNRKKRKDLHITSLEFRLLREHGFKLPQEVFKTFMDEYGNFAECNSEDIVGILSLYEASFLMEEGESILENARDFATKFLNKYVKENEGLEYYSLLANHALELPLHWRMLRLEARWFIDVYQRAENMNPLLLEFAILDFNDVQAVYQEDLKYVSRWWKNTGLGDNLSFARDRLMENFFWTVGTGFRPELTNFRRIIAKVNALITTIDDVYDVYGTLDELDKFTDVVTRWDASAIEQLPNYMKTCFLALHNSMNEVGFDIFKQQEFHVIPFIKQAWIDLCRSYLLEAKWYYSGYKPTLQEYLDNAWISISAPLILIHAYCSVTTPITKETIESLKDYPNIIRWSSIILRLADDLGTSSDEIQRGDVPKSIQCYMYETGTSELEAREHIQYLIGETWKKMNEDYRVAKSLYPQTFVDIAINLARMAQCMYQYGDGHGLNESSETKDRVLSLLIKNIS